MVPLSSDKMKHFNFPVYFVADINVYMGWLMSLIGRALLLPCWMVCPKLGRKAASALGQWEQLLPVGLCAWGVISYAILYVLKIYLVQQSLLETTDILMSSLS